MESTDHIDIIDTKKTMESVDTKYIPLNNFDGVIEDPNINILYEKFKDISKGKKLDTNLLILITTSLIPAVQKIVSDNDNGDYKKNLVLVVLGRIVYDSDLSNESKESLNIFITNTLPMTIDVLIAVAKGSIDIGKKLKQKMWCCF